jgi:hypothetical protein
MSTKRYAIIENGFVSNVIVWDGVSEFPGSDKLIDLSDTPEVGPGYQFDGTKFTAPAPTTAGTITN